MALKQFPLYLEENDLAEYKRLAKPLTLNHWIREILKRHVEATQSLTKKSKEPHSEEKAIAALKRKNSELLEENKKLVAQLEKNEVKEVTFDKDTENLLKDIVETIHSGHCWSSAQIIKKFTPYSEIKTRTLTKEEEEKINDIISLRRVKTKRDNNHWIIIDIISRKEKQITGTNEPNEEDIRVFNNELLYTTTRIIRKDVANKMLIVRPVDRAAGEEADTINLRRAIGRTLEELESLGIIENTRNGWKWIK